MSTPSMTELENTSMYTVVGDFRAQVRVRHEVWYSRRLVELIAIGEPGPRGGSPKTVQVLLTPEQAVDLIAVLSQVVGDAKAADDA